MPKHPVFLVIVERNTAEGKISYQVGDSDSLTASGMLFAIKN